MIKALSVTSENKPSWWQSKNGRLFDIFTAYQKIGSCALAFVDRQKSPRKEQQFFPNSWYDYKESEVMRPILEITGLETFGRRGKGNGRLCLQALYELSNRRGCGGRMQVFSDFNSAAFYEHCGFKGGKAGEDGLKYFDPTPQNLSLLFTKNAPERTFRFIPVGERQSTLSQKDKALFERMLQKGQHS